MIKAVILDDEPKATENFKIIVENFCTEINLVWVYNNASDFLKDFTSLKFDVLFLDVQMPNLNGFQVLDALDRTDFCVVFLTAHPEFALQAFKSKVTVIDYLLKPIEIAELLKTVLKLKSHLLLINQKQSLAQVQDFLKLPSLNGFELVEISSVLYLKASNTYTEIYFDDEKKSAIISKSLKLVEAQLNPNQFLRIHDSITININKVKQYVKGEGGTVILTNGTSLDISRRRKQDFLKLFEK